MSFTSSSGVTGADQSAVSPTTIVPPALESLAIAAVDHWADMHVHAADLGEGLVGRAQLADRVDELARSLARRGAE